MSVILESCGERKKGRKRRISYLENFLFSLFFRERERESFTLWTFFSTGQDQEVVALSWYFILFWIGRQSFGIFALQHGVTGMVFELSMTGCSSILWYSIA